MIITCPACDAQYLLPDEAVGPNGRRVKCTTCDYTWLQRSQEEAPIDNAEEGYEPAPSVIDAIVEEEYQPVRRSRSPAPPPPPKASTLEVLAKSVGAAVLLLALTLTAALIYRPAIVKIWPASALLFETVYMALPAPGAGISLEEVMSDTVVKDGVPILYVKGKLHNTSKENQHLPDLVVRMSSDTKLLKEWPLSLGNKVIKPGVSVNFEYFLEGAPQDGQSVTLVFKD